MATESTVRTNRKPQIIIRPLDDRIPVARPEVFPSRCVGQILVKIKNDGVVQGSGSVISDYTVVTAGHVVKTANNQFRDIEWLRYVPAKNHSSEPYGRYDWEHMRAVFDGASRDWALTSLAQAAGFSTGFLGASARLPINRWRDEGHHFSHIGFPGDHRDEMWIDEDGVCTGIRGSRQLITNIDAAAGQSGGPLAIGWGASGSKVAGVLSGGPNPVEDPNIFTPGWEDAKNDTWFQWLCDHFGKRHADDRFGGCRGSLLKALSGEIVETNAMLPNYSDNTVFVEDNGPTIRRYSAQSTQSWMTPRKVFQEITANKLRGTASKRKKK